MVARLCSLDEIIISLVIPLITQIMWLLMDLLPIGSATIDDSAVIGVDLFVPKIVVNQIDTLMVRYVLSSIEAEGFIEVVPFC